MLAMSSVVGFSIGIIGFIILVALAFWPARVARRKGHSWLLYFIFSLFFFFPALIVAYLVDDRRSGAYIAR
jgi:ABC-type Mn2+/Zn2+ transport system permease subunit